MFHLLKKNAKKRHHLNQGITYPSCFRCFPDFFRLLRCFSLTPPNPSRNPVPQRSQELMGLTYAKHFAESPFAYHGAPSGTTSRLRSWCWKPQIGWFFGLGFWGTSGCNKIFNGKNLVTKNMNMTNMTVMTLFHQFCWILLWFLMISAVSSCTHCCKFESSLTNLKAFAFRPVRSNAVSLH